jgi:hypothetical protein
MIADTERICSGLAGPSPATDPLQIDGVASVAATRIVRDECQNVSAERRAGVWNILARAGPSSWFSRTARDRRFRVAAECSYWCRYVRPDA